MSKLNDFILFLDIGIQACPNCNAQPQAQVFCQQDYATFDGLNPKVQTAFKD